MTLRTVLFISLVMILSSPARAQYPGIETLRTLSSQAGDLVWPAAPSDMATTSVPALSLFKPEGDGPFPALVLVHQCGGLGRANRPNVSMLNWARKAEAKGYVVLMVDSLGPRNVDSVCMGPKSGVTLMRGVKDAFQALRHLEQFAFVDRQRIGLAGYSWGAMIGLLATSRHWSESLGEGRRFRAAVSFYPGCFAIRPPGGTPWEMVQPDLDRPLLVMTGGADTETPAADCAEKLTPQIQAGAPITLHHYPEATHCWDCSSLDGFSKTDVRGNKVEYRFDSAITRDSEERMFGFLAERMR